MEFDSAVVVIPAHNEATNLPACLKAVSRAAACVPVPVVVMVVLDACDDDSGALAGQFGSEVHFVEVTERNVGAARHAGFAYARGLLADTDEARVWYATTDADSRVDPNWLSRQLDSGSDMVLGVVRIANWRRFSASAVRRYLADYRAKRHGDAHGHVHGANMGFRAESYWKTGGFAPLATSEDVDLVYRFEAAGYRIHRDDQLSVVTSAREVGRAPKGFANYLGSLTPRARQDTA